MERVVEHACRNCHRQFKLREEHFRLGKFRCVCGEVLKRWGDVNQRGGVMAKALRIETLQGLALEIAPDLGRDGLNIVPHEAS